MTDVVNPPRDVVRDDSTWCQVDASFFGPMLMSVSMALSVGWLLELPAAIAVAYVFGSLATALSIKLQTLKVRRSRF